MSTIHTSILPHKEILADNTYKIYFTVKLGNKSKYITMREEDKDYILYWIDRFIIDMCAKQVIQPMFLENIMSSSKSMPKSQYSDKRNSVLSYCAGLISNFRRNPTEDFGKNQLIYIKKVMGIIHDVYSYVLTEKDLGYNNITKKKNDAPKKVMFKQV